MRPGSKRPRVTLASGRGRSASLAARFKGSLIAVGFRRLLEPLFLGRVAGTPVAVVSQSEFAPVRRLIRIFEWHPVPTVRPLLSCAKEVSASRTTSTAVSMTIFSTGAVRKAHGFGALAGSGFAWWAFFPVTPCFVRERWSASSSLGSARGRTRLHD